MEIGKYSNDYPARGSFACRITFAKKSRIIDSQRQPSQTVFENHRKSLIGHCERSELHLHFECTKVHQKYQKSPIFESF